MSLKLDFVIVLKKSQIFDRLMKNCDSNFQ